MVLIRATYAWPVWFPGLAQLLNSNNSGDYLVNMANNSHLIPGTAAFRNEPFTAASAAVDEPMTEGPKHCWKNEQGLAAVEFAFVLPILITMLLGLWNCLRRWPAAPTSPTWPPPAPI